MPIIITLTKVLFKYICVNNFTVPAQELLRCLYIYKMIFKNFKSFTEEGL